MADEDIVGIIRVPLNAYTYQPGKGRDEDPEIVKHLSDIFKKEGCKPDLWEHHIKGEIDVATYSRLLIALGLSEDSFRSTVQTGKYPRVRLRKRIICLDGRQRIAAARGKFGTRFWWPVKLYRDPRVSRFSHQTKYSDGEICWHLFRLALGKPDLGGDWRSELSKSKKKILNLLLRRENGEFKHKDIVAALCAVLDFPGARGGFKLGTMHKYTPLRCPEKPVRYLRRMSRIYWDVAGEASVIPHMDSKTISCLQRRNPSNSVDRDYIRLMMDTGQIFRGVKNVSVRRKIKQNLLSLDAIFPSFETFHQNMIYFSVGAKILRTHIIDDPDESQGRDQKDGNEGLFQSLHTCWVSPERPLIEVSRGILQPLVSLEAELASMLLFLDGQRDCLYLSNEPILQDKRNEPAPVAAVDPWFVFRLRARARQYGFRTTKISRGLAVEPPSPRPLNWDLDWDVRAKDWRGGKPTIRNFLALQRDAFLDTLEQADCREKVTAAFVQRDFLEAFFGSWSYMKDGPEMPSNLPPFPIDDEDMGPPSKDAMQIDETPPSSQPHSQPSQRAPPTGQGLEPHQTQEPPQGLLMQEPPSQINPPRSQASLPDPALQVDTQELLVLAKTFENPISGGHGKRNSRYRPYRRRESKPRSKSRSKSPSSRSPISRNRQERPKVGPSRSPIRPPTHATPPSRAERAIEELVRQSPIHPLQANTGPLKRSPIRPPGPTILPVEEESSRRSQIHPPSQLEAPQIPEIPKIPELVPNPVKNALQDEDTNRQPPSRPSPVLLSGLIASVSTIPKTETTEEEPSNQPQAPHPPDTSEGPSIVIDERQTSQLQELVLDQAVDMQQTENLPQDEKRNRGSRQPSSQRDSSRGRPRERSRSRSPSSRSLESWNRRERPTGGRSRSPISLPRLTTRARSLPGAETARRLSRRSPVYPLQNQTPRRSERLHPLSRESAVPTSTSRPSQKPIIMKKVIQTNPLIPQKRKDNGSLWAPVRAKIRKVLLMPPKPKAVPTLPTTAPGVEDLIHQHEEHQNILGIFQASDGLSVTQNPSSESLVGLNSPAAPPKEGSVTRGRKGKRKGKGRAVQNAAETIIDAADFGIMPRYKAISDPQHSQAHSRRSPIRPPGTGLKIPNASPFEGSPARGRPKRTPIQPPETSSSFRVPSTSPEGSLEGGQPGRTLTFRVPSISSEESLQRQTGWTVRVPSASSEESLPGGQMRPTIHPPAPPIFPPAGASGRQNPEAEGAREFQPFSESRVVYPLPDNFWDED
ncbi:hypothetical protein F5Y19DRAFT_446352 [Xylariaceae sp. FL1651]|nr:hypothetical protein F5Y19DRAFT_446352 [Xylariaceae sp. FL1651]